MSGAGKRRGEWPAALLVMVMLAGFLLAAPMARGPDGPEPGCRQIGAQSRQVRHTRPVARGSITGTVVGPDGKPLAGVRVMTQSSDGRSPRATTTDGQGRFRFKGLRIGPYDLRARSGETWSAWTRNVPVRANAESTVKLSIPAAKAAP